MSALESRAGWEEDAAIDIKAPSVGAVVRWARRAARAKGEVAVSDRTLQALLSKQRDVALSLLALTPGGLREAVEKHVDTGEVMDAEKALADAIEAEDFASRVCRLLERPRSKVEVATKPASRFASGVKR